MRILDHLLSGIVAISLAFLVWLYARSRDQETLDNVPVPVHISLPAGQSDNFALEVAPPSQVLVSFTGPPVRIREVRAMLQRGELDVDITLPVPEDRDGQSTILDNVVVDSIDIHTPHGVTAMVVDRHNHIPVTLHRLMETQLPVRFDPSLEERSLQVTAEPVRVRGPQELLEHTHSVSTVPYSISAHAPGSDDKEPFTVGPVAIVQEIEGKRIQTIPTEVVLHVNPKPSRQEREVPATVHFLCPQNFALQPSFVDEASARLTLRIEGPATTVDLPVWAFIDLTRRTYEPGITNERIHVQLPEGYHLAQSRPLPVAIKLAPRNADDR
jgi:hypothetical protein